MPPLPPGLSEWLPPGLQAGVVGFLGFIWYEVKAGEARQAKRIDELRADLKASEARQAKRSDELRADMKEGFAQSRADNKALSDKLDRLVESLLAAKQF